VTEEFVAPAPTGRWDVVLDTLLGVVPPGPASVVVDGAAPDRCALFADRLAHALQAAGRPYERLAASPVPSEASAAVVVADGSRWRAEPPGAGWDVAIWLRTPTSSAAGAGEQGADVVIDLHDVDWPVIRRVRDGLASYDSWYLTESQAFFAARAATWDTRFGDDLPAYAAAVARAGLPVGGVVADIGCGTGRALSALRAAVGPLGVVLGVDVTPEMLAVAAERAAAVDGVLVRGDARRLPLAPDSVDGIFAAGLVNHLPDATEGFGELARVTRSGGRLVLFHPSGRAALAARHGRPSRPDEPLAEATLRGVTDRAGWRLDVYDDAPDRFFALATRR
jgi:SAM-dependent methyltransferase